MRASSSQHSPGPATDDAEWSQDMQDALPDGPDMPDDGPEDNKFSALRFTLPFLQRRWGIGDRKTRDGQPAKRRGPKPDTKPALTRRQEMNRLAQRTHRERKENYIHDVEIAFMNLRQLAHDLIQENKELRGQNGQLREKLTANNIPIEFSSPAQSSYGGPSSSAFGASPRSMGGYTSSGALSTGQSQTSSMPISHPSPPFPQASPPTSNVTIQQGGSIDLENIAMEFVGTYGRTPYLSPPPNL